jgi:hypothetical protein
VGEPFTGEVHVTVGQVPGLDVTREDVRRRPSRSWVGWLLALVVAGCGPAAPDVTWDSAGVVGCALEAVTGTLVDIGGHTALADARWLGPLGSPLFVRWPAGWQVRSSPGGLDVLDATGTVRYRTGSDVALYAAATGTGIARIEGGGLLVCPL